MKVLMLTGGFPPLIGGIENHVKSICDELHEDHEVRLAIFNTSYDSPPDTPYYIRVYDGIDAQGKLASIWQARSDIKKEISDFEPDVVHNHDLKLNYPINLLPSVGATYPYVFTNHSSGFLKEFYKDSLYTGFKQWLWGRRPNAIIAPSTELAEASREITNAPVHMIPNGVDTEQFSPEGEEADIPGAGKNDFIVLTTRRFEEKNGLQYLVEAIPQTEEDVFFVMLGDGSLREELAERVKELGVEERVYMPGNVPNDEIASYYRRADISVLPSLKEAICLSGLESMSCGTPLIGANVGGIPEMINDGQNGYLVSPKNPEGLAQAVEDMRVADTTKMGKKARNAVLERYSWSKVAQRTAEVYSGVR